MQTPEERLAQLYIRCRKALGCDGLTARSLKWQHKEALNRNSKRAMEMAMFLYEKENEVFPSKDA